LPVNPENPFHEQAFMGRAARLTDVDALPHEFKDESLLELALTHASTGLNRDNERLEFLGDAALDLIVAEALYHDRPDLPEGDLTELKAAVVSRRTLAEAARGLDLARRARLGRGLKRTTLSRSVMANLYEAVLGAVYLDAGLEAAAAFARLSLAEQLAGVEDRRKRDSPKQRLQEFAQRNSGAPPTYHVLRSRGQAHRRAFLVQAEIENRTFPSGWGRTRKEGEYWAAFEALLVLGENELV
jgi:ribonuclease-3